MSLGALLSGLVVAAAASLTCVAGVELSRFARADVAAQELLDELVAQDLSVEETQGLRERDARVKEVLSRLQPWLARDGVVSEARWFYGAIKAIRDPSQAEKGIISHLSVEPSSGEQWAELARLRLARGAPMPQVLSALQMSSVTMPRELGAMQRRLLLLLKLWGTLPDDGRRQAIKLLVELRGGYTPSVQQMVKTLIAAMTKEERQGLAENVTTRAGAEVGWRRQIGLP